MQKCSAYFVFIYQSGELLELFRKLPLFDTQHFHLSTYTHSSVEHLLSPSYVVGRDRHFKNSISCSHDIYYVYYTTSYSNLYIYQNMEHILIQSSS